MRHETCYTLLLRENIEQGTYNETKDKKKNSLETY